MKAVGFIFARGGSKGVPDKNIQEIAGKPLIAHAVEQGLSCRAIDKLVVSTDDPGIADIARAYGAEVPFTRPTDLATDAAPEWLAWQHACQYELTHGLGDSFDIFVSLPATSPCRSLEDVEKAISLLDNGCDVVVTGSRSNHHPSFNMVAVNSRDNLVKLLDQKGSVVRRQDAPSVYNLATLAYVSRPEFILSSDNIWEGRVKLCEVSSINAIDIDTQDDFYLAELVLNDRKK